MTTGIALISDSNGQLGITGPSGQGVLQSSSDRLRDRFLIILMTQKGSSRYRPTYGTAFLSDSKYAWRTEGDVRRSFLSAMTDLARQIKAIPEVDPAAQFGSATITAVKFTDRVSVDITIQLMSAASVAQAVSVVV